MKISMLTLIYMRVRVCVCVLERVWPCVNKGVHVYPVRMHGRDNVGYIYIASFVCTVLQTDVFKKYPEERNE